MKNGTIRPDMLRKEATRLRKRYEYELDEKERTPFIKNRNTKFKIFSEDCITGCRKHIDSNSIDLIINDPPFGIGDDNIGNRYARCEDNVIDGYVEVPVTKYEDFSYQFMVEVLTYSQDTRIYDTYLIQQSKLVLKNEIISFGNIVLV